VSHDFVVLHLDPSRAAAPPGTDAPLLRQSLEEAIGTLGEVAAALDTPMQADAVATADTCCSALEGGAPAETVQPLAAACYTAMRQVAVSARDAAAEQRGQMLALSDTVRAAVAAAGGEQHTLEESLTGTADRFERLSRTGNIRLIQAQLLKEVASLRQLTLDRRAAWERNRQELESRLDSLATQLDRTRHEAATDPLTGAANRRAFEEACRAWLVSGSRSFVLACVDVDNFKAINDGCGHAVGDRVLKAVAGALSQAMRTDDLVARPGGDEFAVLAASMTLPQAHARFSTVATAVRDTCCALLPSGMVASVSIGLAERSAGDTLESLQQRADDALYQAKRNGRGRVVAREAPLIRDLLTARRAAR